MMRLEGMRLVRCHRHQNVNFDSKHFLNQCFDPNSIQNFHSNPNQHPSDKTENCFHDVCLKFKFQSTDNGGIDTTLNLNYIGVAKCALKGSFEVSLTGSSSFFN